MTRDPLQILVHLFATETNPDQLVLRVVSESSVLEEARRLSHTLIEAGAGSDGRIIECCRLSKIPVEFFWERLQLLARILNLIPYDQNYYEILGIDHLASPHDVKQAFRRLSFACHPDTNPHDPNAAENFRNLQHAYQVLSHDLLRRRYDYNQGEHFWEEENTAEGLIAGQVRWSKWRRTWPVGLLLMLLVATTFVVDYSQWQTERYYADMKTRPARVEPDLPTPPANTPVRAGDKAAPLAASGPAASAPKPEQPSLIRKTAEGLSNKPISVPPNEPESQVLRDEESAKPALPGQLDFWSHPAGTANDAHGTRTETPRHATQKPSETASLSSGGAPREGSSPQNVVGGTRSESLMAATAASPQAAATTKANQKLPPPVSLTEKAPMPPGKGQESRQHAGVKQAGPTSAATVRQDVSPPATPAGSPASKGFVRVENLDHEIRSFLSRYTTTYEARDMGAFMRFFEANAIENGRPIQELLPMYQANFKRAEKLRYQIKVGRWEMGEDEVMVDGSFSLAVQFEREAPVESTGSIQLTLVRRAGDFGVKRLNYIFRESRRSAE